jgi:hypothetical protein
MLSRICLSGCRVRTQVQLDEDQYARLKALASAGSESISQVVRDAVERRLAEGERRENSRRGGKVSRRAGATDVASRHDD